MFYSSVCGFQFRSFCGPSILIVCKTVLKTLNVFPVRLIVSITQIFYYHKEYDLDGGLICFYMGHHRWYQRGVLFLISPKILSQSLPNMSEVSLNTVKTLIKLKK